MLSKEHNKEDNSRWGRMLFRVYETGSLAMSTRMPYNRPSPPPNQQSVSHKLCLPAQIIRAWRYADAEVDALGYLGRTPLLALFSFLRCHFAYSNWQQCRRESSKSNSNNMQCVPVLSSFVLELPFCLVVFFIKFVCNFMSFYFLHASPREAKRCDAFGIPVAVIWATCLRIKIFQRTFCLRGGNGWGWAGRTAPKSRKMYIHIIFGESAAYAYAFAQKFAAKCFRCR